MSAITTQVVTNLYGFINFNIILQNFTTSSGNAFIRFSTDGGSTYNTTNYSAGSNRVNSSSTVWTNTSSTSGLQLIASASANAIDGNYILYNMNSTSGFIFLTGTVTVYQATFSTQLINGRVTVASQNANAFEILVLSGTMTGTILIYGLS